ncbi:MAG: hypothetical protein IK127_05185 [Clostridia bacterium]|nr:hypothetical protein [Clostridia bacterium]
MKELNMEMLNQANGGAWKEAQAYFFELCKKYGTNSGCELNNLVTAEEFEHMQWLLNH